MIFERDEHVPTEADLLAEFYHRARLAGLEVYLEYRLPSSLHRSGEMRVDAVVVHGNEIICCVEVKREGRSITPGTRQDRAYRSLEWNYGLRTVWINSKAGLDEVIADIKGATQMAA